MTTPKTLAALDYVREDRWLLDPEDWMPSRYRRRATLGSLRSGAGTTRALGWC